jgi:oxygen-dependent protoporphyrinogen oxidase
VDDESVGSLLQRRLGTADIGDNIVSAVFHGIYAGDIYQLSAKSLLPYIWFVDGQSGSFVDKTIRNILDPYIALPHRDAALLKDLLSRTQSLARFDMGLSGVFTFKSGISALSEKLEMLLKTKSKVQIKRSHKIKKLQYDGETDSVKV